MCKWEAITLHPLAVRSRSNCKPLEMQIGLIHRVRLNNAADKKYGSYPKGFN